MRKTKKQLEDEKKLKDKERELKEKNTLLVKTEKRFRRTRLDNMEPKRKYEDTKKYIIEKSGFEFQLYFNENSGDGNLWVLNPLRQIVVNYKITEDNYALTIKRMYEEVRQRVIDQKDKEKNKESREHERTLKRLIRFP
jgi:hypothetical protein